MLAHRTCGCLPCILRGGASRKHSQESASQTSGKLEGAEPPAEDGGHDDTGVWSAALVAALTVGVSTDFVVFSDSDAHIAYQVQAHDIDSNKYRPTAILDLVRLVERVRSQVPGGDWKHAQTKLEGLYGKQKRMWVYRAVTCARMLPESICLALQEFEVPNSYIYDNPYFVGSGVSEQKRLSTENRIRVASGMREDMALGRGMSAKTFQAPCRPRHNSTRALPVMSMHAFACGCGWGWVCGCGCG